MPQSRQIKERYIYRLRRILPNEVPEVDLYEANDEITTLLEKHGMNVPREHLKQAIECFDAENWASANAQLRSFFEGYLNEIAVKLGCEASKTGKQKRDFLGENGFLSSDLNEWNDNKSKQQYIQGLMNRMHPDGSHPGLSDKDDCVFRLQITLITARLLLRRFDREFR
jgi:hypothetical protein